MGLWQSWKEKRLNKKHQTDRHRRNPQLMRGQDEYAFRRSRTIIGSTSSQIKASSEQQAQLKSPRLKAQELRQHRRKISLVLLACLAGVALLGWLLTQFVATTEVKVAGVRSVVSADEYNNAIQVYFNEQPLERFQFALNEKALIGYVQQSHPEVKEVSSEPNAAIGKGSFVITMREPAVGWNVGGRQYYVDTEGASFAKNYYDTPNVVVEDESGITPEATENRVVASNRFLSFLGRIVGLTSQSGIGGVEKVTIPAGIGSRSVELKLTDREYPIRMHIDRDPAAQVEDMKQAVQFFEQHGLTPQYIDVRVAGKAFYREDE